MDGVEDELHLLSWEVIPWALMLGELVLAT